MYILLNVSDTWGSECCTKVGYEKEAELLTNSKLWHSSSFRGQPLTCWLFNLGSAVSRLPEKVILSFSDFLLFWWVSWHAANVTVRYQLEVITRCDFFAIPDCALQYATNHSDTLFGSQAWIGRSSQMKTVPKILIDATTLLLLSLIRDGKVPFLTSFDVLGLLMMPPAPVQLWLHIHESWPLFGLVFFTSTFRIQTPILRSERPLMTTVG